jgi:elongation of very long chain fatty acids protein 4
MSAPNNKIPSTLARYTTASILIGCLSVWAYYAYPPKDATPGLTVPMHSVNTTIALTAFYLISLPSLKWFTEKFLAPKYDMKLLLTESMVIYNVAQVALNGWMVYAMINAVVNGGHPFIGSRSISGVAIESGASYAVWVHYCDKYLEFFDTYFMVLRGKMDQVSFLHIYHHTTIAWAWWIALRYSPGGDIYFGALLNSIIHVMMYSYYALALMKVSCPWKRHLTKAQLLQFTSVVIYTAVTGYKHYYNVPHEAIEGVQPSMQTYFICCAVQVFEMVSLFVLFSFFYKRKYSKKNKGVKESEDECHKAMGEISSAAKEVAGHAAKDASKLMSSASKVVKRSNVQRSVGAM